MSRYTYRTDAVHSDMEYATEAEAVAAAIASGDWDEIDSAREAECIADGAWLCIFSDGVPSTVRGEMP